MERRRRLIVLWVTGTCQLSCKYCYATHRSSEKMEESVAFAALQLFEKEPLTVQFAGGEPLLNWELIEAVTEYVEKQRPGTRLQLQTNGISMDRRITSGSIKLRPESAWMGFRRSTNGCAAGRQRRWRGSGRWAKQVFM